MVVVYLSTRKKRRYARILAFYGRYMPNDKKLYYLQYHKKNYKKLDMACALCGEISCLGHKKYCDKCRNKIPSTCIDCKKEFLSKAKYRRCPRCQYHWYKKNHPENFKAVYRRMADKDNAKRRILKGLPVDHVFPKGPKGLGYKNKKGYVLMVYKDPTSGKTKRKYQHVLVMMQHLGRELRDYERVHHKNGVRDDNRLENLELWTTSHPSGQRAEDKIAWCVALLAEYGYKVVKE